MFMKNAGENKDRETYTLKCYLFLSDYHNINAFMHDVVVDAFAEVSRNQIFKQLSNINIQTAFEIKHSKYTETKYSNC